MSERKESTGPLSHVVRMQCSVDSLLMAHHRTSELRRTSSFFTNSLLRARSSARELYTGVRSALTITSRWLLGPRVGRITSVPSHTHDDLQRVCQCTASYGTAYRVCQRADGLEVPTLPGDGDQRFLEIVCPRTTSTERVGDAEASGPPFDQGWCRDD